jgi:hypothetical protein
VVQDSDPDLPCYPFLSFPEIKTHILSSLSAATTACSLECNSAQNVLQHQMYDACPAVRKGRWEEYDKMLPYNLKTNIEFSLQPFFANGFHDRPLELRLP